MQAQIGLLCCIEARLWLRERQSAGLTQHTQRTNNLCCSCKTMGWIKWTDGSIDTAAPGELLNRHAFQCKDRDISAVYTVSCTDTHGHLPGTNYEESTFKGEFNCENSD